MDLLHDIHIEDLDKVENLEDDLDDYSDEEQESDLAHLHTL